MDRSNKGRVGELHYLCVTSNAIDTSPFLKLCQLYVSPSLDLMANDVAYFHNI
jgi:hypothetical protein